MQFTLPKWLVGNYDRFKQFNELQGQGNIL